MDVCRGGGLLGFVPIPSVAVHDRPTAPARLPGVGPGRPRRTNIRAHISNIRALPALARPCQRNVTNPSPPVPKVR